MTMTVDSPVRPPSEAPRRRGLVAAVVVLAVVALGLGAWIIYDVTSEPATAPTDEIATLMEDYLAAYTEGDSEAFLAVTTDDYRFESIGEYAVRSTQQAAIAIPAGVSIDRVGDMMMMGDGPTYFVVTAEELTYGGAVYEGVSAFLIVDTGDGLKVREHTHYGNL